MSTIKHVVLAGETGVGKSTLINLLKGEKVAEADNDAKPCTTKAKSYDIVDPVTKVNYYIWDTRGLNEAAEQESSLDRLLKFIRIKHDAERELKNLLRDKHSPKISLVLLCIDTKKIKVPVQWKIYEKIFADFCEKKIRVVVIVTQMGDEGIERCEWKKMAQEAAKGIYVELPDFSMMEAVPKFDVDWLNESKVEVCRTRIFKLLSSC